LIHFYKSFRQRKTTKKRKMSVVGIDFGNDTCYISVARQGGIESIANDYSLRATPSYVAFGEKQRTLGVAAKSGQMTNVNRTFFGFKPLLGRTWDDPHVQAELARFPFEVTRTDSNHVGFVTEFMGQKKQLLPSQLTAALFTKLKITAETALNAVVNDVVISVPSHFTNAERWALLDSARLAGLNVLKLMNETTATALAYGIYKQDLPESDKPSRNVVFVDAGHTTTQVSACSFNKGKLNVLCSTYCSVGGRLFDEAITKYFKSDFATRYKLDVGSNKKATLKLMTEAEKLKKLMSANSNTLPLNIECFMNDKDVRGEMDRATFLQLIDPELVKVKQALQECLEASKLKKEDIYSVEIVGGSSRIPSIKSLIEQVYGKTPSTTLNADEAVSRGCALQCAILSPTFKVREFSVTDVQPYPIRLVWSGNRPEDVGDQTVFEQFHSVPYSKMLTFIKSEQFHVAAEYSGPVPYPNKHIGEFNILDVKPDTEGKAQKVKVKVRINANGIFVIPSANLFEKQAEKEAPVPMEGETIDGPAKEKEEAPAPAEGAEDKMETDDSAKTDAATAEENKEKEAPAAEAPKKPKTKAIDLPVSSRMAGHMSEEKLETAQQEERAMHAQDKQESERLTAKNSFEEYIYDIRGKLCDELEDFILEDDRAQFTRHLEDMEDWLYDDGEYAERSIYQNKLGELKEKGEAVKRRKREWEERPDAMNNLRQCLLLAQKTVDQIKAGDPKYAHLDMAEVGKVEKAIAEKTEWVDRMTAEVNKLKKTSDPTVLASQFHQEKELFWSMAAGILHKPQPKVEPPPPPKSDDANASANKADANTDQQAKADGGEANGDASATNPSSGNEATSKTANTATTNDMDVD